MAPGLEAEGSGYAVSNFSMGQHLYGGGGWGEYAQIFELIGALTDISVR